METNTKNTVVSKADKVAERTISITIAQLRRLAENDVLRALVIDQIEFGEGNLKGSVAIKIAEGIERQMKMKMEEKK